MKKDRRLEIGIVPSTLPGLVRPNFARFYPTHLINNKTCQNRSQASGKFSY